MSTPVFDEDLRLFQRAEGLAVEKLVSEFTIKPQAGSANLSFHPLFRSFCRHAQHLGLSESDASDAFVGVTYSFEDDILTLEARDTHTFHRLFKNAKTKQGFQRVSRDINARQEVSVGEVVLGRFK